MQNLRALFILKLRQTSGNNGVDPNPNLSISSGLLNSVKFIVERLEQLGIVASIAQVEDANGIDKAVTAFKPTNVILEAVWCPPRKFDELLILHPGVNWTVRIHSEIPFLANEGMAMKWLMEYISFEQVSISCNSLRATTDLRTVVQQAHTSWNQDKLDNKVVYLPNYYPIGTVSAPPPRVDDGFLNVGCFGAIRPMKNQLMQAFAAVGIAASLKKTLRFYVNGTRIEQNGENVLKNLEALMEATGNQLVRIDWEEHAAFVKLLSTIDLGMQVSFSETFNIVSADLVVSSVPIVVSPEVTWTTTQSQANPTDLGDIMSKALLVLGPNRKLIEKLNLIGLQTFSQGAQVIWLAYLNDFTQ